MQESHVVKEHLSKPFTRFYSTEKNRFTDVEMLTRQFDGTVLANGFNARIPTLTMMTTEQIHFIYVPAKRKKIDKRLIQLEKKRKKKLHRMQLTVLVLTLSLHFNSHFAHIDGFFSSADVLNQKVFK